MAAMNAKVDVDGMDAKDVAHDFLVEQGSSRDDRLPTANPIKEGKSSRYARESMPGTFGVLLFNIERERSLW